jgi:hypothetical protein
VNFGRRGHRERNDQELLSPESRDESFLLIRIIVYLLYSDTRWQSTLASLAGNGGDRMLPRLEELFCDCASNSTTSL